MNKKNKKIIIIVSVFLFLIVILSISLLRKKNKNANKPTEIKTAIAYENIFTRTIDVSGYLQAADVQKVQFRGTGAITGVYVKVGDKVKKGQLLATIDDTSQRYNLLKLEYDIEKNKATASAKELEMYELQLQLAKNNMEYTKAVANFDGEVTEVNIHVGDYSEAATTLNLMQIVDKSFLKAYVIVDEMDVKNLYEGMEVMLNFDSLPNEPVKARINYIPFLGTYDSSTGIGVKSIELRIDDPPADIYPGYSFSAQIKSESNTKYLMVQSSAIKSKRGKNYINKKNSDGTFSEVEVSIKYLGEGLTQIVSGDIKVGDVYALSSKNIVAVGKGQMSMGSGPGTVGAGGQKPF